MGDGGQYGPSSANCSIHSRSFDRDFPPEITAALDIAAVKNQVRLLPQGSGQKVL